MFPREHSKSLLPLTSIPLMLLSLGCAAEAPVGVRPVENFEWLQKRLAGLKRPGYEIFQVRDEGGAVRVDLVLTPEPNDEFETERRTLNALRDLQAFTTDQIRLATWCYSADRQAIRGMAFYSPTTENYHFKPGRDLK